MDPSSWVEQQLVPTMVDHGSFGDRSKQRLETTKCKVTHTDTGDDHYTSTVLLINLQIKFEHQATKAYSLFVKVTPEDPIYRKYFDSDVLFHNEIHMYREVIPFVEEFLKNSQVDVFWEIFPKCYYAESGTACVGGKDIIVLEDMVPRGFTPSAERLVLDYDHCALALRQLARYHAVSYGMKKLETSRFLAVVKNIRTQNFGQSSPDDWSYFLKTTSYRAVKYLERRQEIDQATLERLKNRLEHAGQHVVNLMEPKEPLAVLCHGDFCRNNILFRYESGKPCDAVLFDLQNVTYASPAIDLSLFLYLNTSSELRNQHWDDLFGEYHATLTGTLARILGCSVEDLLPDYGLDKFQKDFVAHGFYGYVICSRFLGQMLVDREDQIDLKVMCQKNIRDLAHGIISLGGEIVSQKVADILEHLASKDAI
jgi:thiamine kinase-like enzyme